MSKNAIFGGGRGGVDRFLSEVWTRSKAFDLLVKFGLDLREGG